ncbi:hypothetical protein [Algoriphagus sp.]|uniref:hypothetical protein n=1 Tax=Algoriphagus sp. TaxID=1872435 RepID=UPI0026069F70|nr:hypothetical protein [Algoriphagus sp.]
MNNQYDLEQLEAYLHGTANSEQQRQIQEALEQDEELKRQLAILELALKSIRLSGWQDDIKLAQRTYLQNRKPENLQVKQVFLGSWLGRIAASLVFFLIGALILVVMSTSPESFLESKSIRYRVPVTRGTIELSEMEQAYRREKFESVLSLHQRQTAPSQKSTFLAAMAALEIENGPQAIQLLQAVRIQNQESDSMLYEDEVDFYLVKAFVMTGNFEEAQKEIQQILRDPNHSYRGNLSRWDEWKVKIMNLKY